MLPPATQYISNAYSRVFLATAFQKINKRSHPHVVIKKALSKVSEKEPENTYDGITFLTRMTTCKENCCIARVAVEKKTAAAVNLQTVRFWAAMFQQRLLADVLQNKCSWKFCNIHRKIPVLESLFNKIPGLQACNLFKKTL